MAAPPRSLTAPPLTLTSRLPNRVQGQPFGTKAAVRPTQSLGTEPVAILQPGSAQGLEQYNGPDVPPAISRQLNDMQRNIGEAIGQVKADPTANKVLHEGVALNAGILANGSPTNPTIVAHGLAQPYRGFRLCAVRGGTIAPPVVLPPTTANPATTHIILYVPQLTEFTGQTVVADFEVYA